jgi:hypothetical protein
MIAKVGDLEEWAALVGLISAAATGAKSESSLHYGNVEPAFRGLLKIAAMPKDWEAPPDNLSIDLWALGHSLVKLLSDVVAPSTPIGEDEMERLRVVFARLARLAAAVEGVSLTALPRHARRTLVAQGVRLITIADNKPIPLNPQRRILAQYQHTVTDPEIIVVRPHRGGLNRRHAPSMPVPRLRRRGAPIDGRRICKQVWGGSSVRS